MTVDRMIALCDGILDEVRPLYENLHAWARHALADRYNAPGPTGRSPPTGSPTDGARTGRAWSRGSTPTARSRARPASSSPEQAEAFYVSLGFPKLPRSFYEKSDLYPADPKSGRKKNSHASAWHIDLQRRRPEPDEHRARHAVVQHGPPRTRATSTTS